MDSKKYFFLAWTEEQLNCDAAALLLYLSSFCSSLEEGPASLSAGTINKIAHLRKKLGSYLFCHSDSHRLPPGVGFRS